MLGDMTRQTRDRGLERVGNITMWVAAGSVAATGVFAAALANHPSHAAPTTTATAAAGSSSSGQSLGGPSAVPTIGNSAGPVMAVSGGS